MGSDLEIRVCGLTGMLCVLKPEEAGGLTELKLAIEQATGIPRWEQQLVAGTEELTERNFSSQFSRDLTMLRQNLSAKDWRQIVERNPEAFQHAPVSVKQDRDVALKAISQAGHSLKYATCLQADRGAVMTAVQEAGSALQYAAEPLRSDPEVVLAAARNDAQALAYASSQLLDDRRFLLSVLRRNAAVYTILPRQLRESFDFALAAAEQNGDVLAHMEKEFREDPVLVTAAVKQNGLAIRHAAPWLRADRDCVRLAVSENEGALQYAADSLQADRALVLSAIPETGLGLALQHASEELLLDRDFLLDAIHKNADALLHSPAEGLHNSRSFMMEAVRRNGGALKNATSDLQADPEVVKSAIRHHSAAFLSAAVRLQTEPGFVKEALDVNGLIMEHLGEKFSHDHAMAMRAIRQNWKSFRFLPLPLRKDRDIVLAAVRQNGMSVRYAAGTALTDPDIAVEAIRQDWRSLQFLPLGLRGNRDIAQAAVDQDRRALQYLPLDLQSLVGTDIQTDLGDSSENGTVIAFLTVEACHAGPSEVSDVSDFAADYPFSRAAAVRALGTGKEVIGFARELGGGPPVHLPQVVPKIVFTKQALESKGKLCLRPEETRTVLTEIQGRPILVGTDDYAHIFKAFLKLHLWEQVVHLWQSMKQEGMVSNSRASGNVAESFIRGGTWAGSLVILNTMHAERLGLRNAAQGAALAVCRQRRLWQEALQQFLQEGIFTLLTMKRMFSILADADQVGLLKTLLALFRQNERTSRNAPRVAANAFAEAGLWQAHRFTPGQQLLEKVREKPSLANLASLACRPAVEVMGAKFRAARWREACFLVASQRSNDTFFSVALLSNAVGACSRAARLQEAFYLLQLMRRRGYWPTVRTFNLVLLACARAGNLHQALEVLAEMRFSMRDPDLISYSTCISATEKARDWATSLLLLRKIQTAGLREDAIAVSTVIKICEKASATTAVDCPVNRLEAGCRDAVCAGESDIDKILALGPNPVLEEMMPILRQHRGSLERNPQYATNLLKILVDEGRGPVAMLVLNFMRTNGLKINKSHCNVLMNAMQDPTCKAAVRWLAWMRSASVPPDTRTYNIALKLSREVRQWKMALHFLQEMGDKHVAPNHITLNTAIDTCIRAGELQTGLRLVASLLEKRGLDLDDVTLGTLLQAFQEAGQWEQALLIFSSIPRMRLQQTAFHFAGAMNSCAVSGQWEWTLELLDRMQHKLVSPDEVCYNTILSACEEGEQWELAIETFTSMFGQKLIPNQRSFTSAISACGTCQQWEAALALFRLMPNPNRIHWNAVISSSAQSAWPSAFALFHRMIRESVPPDLDTMGSAMQIYQSAGHWPAALHLFASMTASADPDMRSRSRGYNYALDALHEVDCAAHLWNQAVREAVFPGVMKGGPNKLDLHGLSFGAAKLAVKWWIHEVVPELLDAASPPPYFLVIVGRLKGRRGEPVLRGMVIEYLDSLGLAWKQSKTSKLADWDDSQGLEWEHPLQLLTQMYGSSLRPDTVAVSSVLRTLQEGMRWRDNCHMLHNMKQRAFRDDIKAHNSAASALEKVSKWEGLTLSSTAALAGMLQKDEASFGVMLGFRLAVSGLRDLVRGGFRATPQFLGMALEAGREEPSMAPVVAALLGELKERMAKWLHPPSRSSDEAMLGIRESSAAVEMLHQYDVLEGQTYTAFHKRACRPSSWLLGLVRAPSADGRLGPDTVIGFEGIRRIRRPGKGEFVMARTSGLYPGVPCRDALVSCSRRMFQRLDAPDRLGASSETVTAWTTYLFLCGTKGRAFGV
ncbi:PTAC2 [Symbiodinium sp. CCMP2456]|nr:PTAC2 [Symbiodinium sp. CCMP2456]